MPWIRRPLGENLCYHVRVQCNNRSYRFEEHADFCRYLDIVSEAKRRFHFLLHHFTIMHTHVHLILTTPGPALLDKIMQFINRQYAVDYHRRHHRTGHFWMHGYRCSVIDTDLYALTCMRYLDRNATRAGLVQDPADWPWCAYNHYAFGRSSYPIDTNEAYLGAAQHPEQRKVWYREFVQCLLPSDESRDKDTICSALYQWTARTTRASSVTI